MRKYPKYRKHRDVTYSSTYKVVKMMGIEKIKHLWSKYGMYKTAELVSSKELTITPRMINYLAVKNKWQRDVRLVPNIHKAYLAGKIDPGNFQTLDFSHAMKHPGSEPTTTIQKGGL